MLNFLPSPLLENIDDKVRIIVWKGELAVFLLFAERRIKFKIISERFLDEVRRLTFSFFSLSLSNTKFSFSRFLTGR